MSSVTCNFCTSFTFLPLEIIVVGYFFLFIFEDLHHNSPFFFNPVRATLDVFAEVRRVRFRAAFTDDLHAALLILYWLDPVLFFC